MSALLKFSLGWIMGGAFWLCGGWTVFADTDLTYAITRNGRPIGNYRFSIKEQDGRREVEAAMKIKVKLVFLTVYKAEHHRHDVWVDGRLERSTGKSAYIGKSYDLDLSRKEDGRYLCRVNGTTEELSGPVVTYVPWRTDVAGEVIRFSEKGATHVFTITYAGRETMPLGGRPLEVDKYLLQGDRQEEVWYDLQGTLQRVRYQKGGAEVEFRLTSPDLAPTDEK